MFSIPGLKVVSLTDAAARRIREIMVQSARAEPEAPALGLRVGVKKGGCAGMEYTFEVARAVGKGDEVVTEKDATVIVDAKEVLFHGANDPKQPIAFGWLRASHRKLDPKLSEPYRPYHTHDEKQPLTPGEPVELDVEIWPTCIVIPPGYRLGLWVRGKDYSHGQTLALDGVKYTMDGTGPFKHDEPSDRPPEIFGGRNTLHFGPGEKAPYLLLPIIPPRGHEGDD